MHFKTTDHKINIFHLNFQQNYNLVSSEFLQNIILLITQDLDTKEITIKS